jgi:hypothetical protein
LSRGAALARCRPRKAKRGPIVPGSRRGRLRPIRRGVAPFAAGVPERGAPVPCSGCRRCCVVIPIRSLEQVKLPRRAVVPAEHEPAAGADRGEPSDMHAGGLAAGAGEPGQVAGLEARNALGLPRRALREAEAVVAPLLFRTKTRFMSLSMALTGRSPCGGNGLLARLARGFRRQHCRRSLRAV